jgi:hypothetical protein
MGYPRYPFPVVPVFRKKPRSGGRERPHGKILFLLNPKELRASAKHGVGSRVDGSSAPGALRERERGLVAVVVAVWELVCHT